MAGEWWLRLRLFLYLLWRPIERPGHVIPDEYRIRGRVSARLAWQIARDVHNAGPNIPVIVATSCAQSQDQTTPAEVVEV